MGVLGFALCLETPLLHLLFVVLMALWAGMEVIGFGDLGMWLFGRWPFLPNGAYSLPLLALPGFPWAYRRNSPLTLGLYAPLVAWWVILQPFSCGRAVVRIGVLPTYHRNVPHNRIRPLVPGR